MRGALDQARYDEAQIAPGRTAMIRLARDYATVANDLLDSSCDAFLAPALSLYREAIYSLLANDVAGRKALSVDFETAPDSILAEAVRRDASLGRARHLLAMHASVSVGGPITPDQRDMAQMTRNAVGAMLKIAETGQLLPLLRRRRVRVAVAAGLLALCLTMSARTVVHLATPTDLAAGKPWRTSSTLSAVYSARMLFHTSEERNPWFEIDLGEIKPVRRLTVKNRADSNGERAVPLIAELSNDRSNWKVVARRESPFTVWEPSFAPTEARFVRLRVPRLTFLHLEQVKVY
jgi:F5/8 type C domain.